MSVEALGWAMGQSVGNPTQKLILLGLANHARRDGSGAWPSVKTLAEYAEVSERQVQRHLRSLEAEGWIEAIAEVPQELVGKRADRRPVVYDLARMMRGDTRDAPQSDGVTPGAERGDIAASPESSITVLEEHLPTGDNALILDDERSDPETGLRVWVDSGGKVRQRVDLLWEAACSIWGTPATDIERGKRNREVGQLRKARVAPDELARLVQKAVTRWNGEARPGLTGILRNLGDLREGFDVTPAGVDEWASDQERARRLARAAELDKGLPG